MKEGHQRRRGIQQRSHRPGDQEDGESHPEPAGPSGVEGGRGEPSPPPYPLGDQEGPEVYAQHSHRNGLREGRFTDACLAVPELGAEDQQDGQHHATGGNQAAGREAQHAQKLGKGGSVGRAI